MENYITILICEYTFFRLHHIASTDAISVRTVPLFIHEFNLFIRICSSFRIDACFSSIQIRCRFEFDIFLPFYKMLNPPSHREPERDMHCKELEWKSHLSMVKSG